MEEKERYYSLIDNNGNFELRDYESNKNIHSLYELDDLLNQQDKEIKQLKEENIKLKKIMGVMKNKKIEELQECKCDNCNLSLLYPVKDSEFVNDLKNDNDSLCEENQKLTDNLDKLIYENQRLKEENGYIIFSDGYDENGNEVHKQEFVKYKDKFKGLFEENKKLIQSQKQLAIDELVKLKQQFSTLFLYSTFKVLKPIIDNQIEKLKR